MKRIGIIGGGFTGTMTAVQLIRQSNVPMHILLINEQSNFNRGAAYKPYSKEHLLNVITAKMTAFGDEPNHFLHWIMKREDFKDMDETVVANAFMPRYLFGEYLGEIWKNALGEAERKGITVECLYDVVKDIDKHESSVTIFLRSLKTATVDYCVIATGNQVPANVRIKNMDFYNSKHYYRNPWTQDCVTTTADEEAVLIIGNGLTMVDTVLGLLEHHFQGQIYSISPNGFNILPHRHNGLKYTKLVEELPDKKGLLEIFSLVHKHIKLVRKFGVSAEAVIDSIRPHTQQLWRSFTDAEKKTFMARFRHLWGVARHRIPLHIHDKLQQLRIDGKLKIIAGRLINMKEEKGLINVEHFNRKTGKTEILKVSRVINCTGPDSDIEKMDMNFLQNCFVKGIITQDALKLGVATDINTFEVIDGRGIPGKNLFTIGSNLRGELWESTAVPELREQAKKLAAQLIRISRDRSPLKAVYIEEAQLAD